MRTSESRRESVGFPGVMIVDRVVKIGFVDSNVFEEELSRYLPVASIVLSATKS